MEEFVGIRSNLSNESKFLKFFRNFDIFTKLEEDIKIRTPLSGAVSILSFFLIFCLLLYEFFIYIFPKVDMYVGVNTSKENRLSIHLDLELYRLPCSEYGIDLMDSAGDQVLGMNSFIKKSPGKNGIGCRYVGTIEVNRVKGEFHLAFGKVPEAIEMVNVVESTHLHRFSIEEMFTFNCSHKIHKLTFGDDFPGAIHPLNGVERIPIGGMGRYEYYLQVVPTVYRYQNGEEIYSNLYSVTEHSTIIIPQRGSSFRQPGLYFRYDVCPYSITYVENLNPFSHFLMQVCAIVGGVYVVLGNVSNFIWYIERTYFKTSLGRP